MPFVPRPFTGATFFADVRPLMTDRALFAGTDADLRYIVMDTAFYKFETFLRPLGKTFVAAASELQALAQSVRVVANASFVHNYDYARLPGPDPAPSWEGEVIQGHTLIAGVPASRPDHRYIGQWDGQTEVAFQFDRGDPSGVTDPTTFNNAIGGLMPIIKRGVPFGRKEKRDGDGNLLVAPSNAIAEWTSKHDGTGKMIVGIHRGEQILFVLAQANGWSLTGGIAILDMIGRLASMGVDDAVMGDGSDSVTLLLDGAAELTPIYYKNKSLTTGFAFRQQQLDIEPNGARLLIDPATTDPLITMGYRSQRGFAMPDVGRLKFVVSSLGVQVGSQLLATLLGLTMPLELVALTSKLTTPATYRDQAGAVEASLSLKGSRASAGTVSGKITFTTTRGKAVFQVNWPVNASDP